MSEENFESLLTPTGELILKDKKIVALEKSMFSSLTNRILHLDLRDNLIINLENNIILELTHLRSLDIRNNKLEILTDKITALEHLKILKLDHNLLTVLPNGLFKLPLRSLTVSDNTLYTLNPQIGNLLNLESLSLAENHLQEIPNEIQKLKSLKILHLHGNEFSVLPVGISGLSSLEEFSLEWFRYLVPSSTKLVKGLIGLPIILRLKEVVARFNGINLHQFLLEFSEDGFEINNLDSRFRNLAHLASASGDIGVLTGLIEAKININQIDIEGFSPLMTALKEDNIKCAKILVQSGAQFDIGGGVFGSVLNLAVLKSEPWLVSTILKSASGSLSFDSDGNTCLHHLMSVFKKHKHRNALIADMIIQAGVNKNHLNNEGWSALHIAARKGQASAFRWVYLKNKELQLKGEPLFDLNIQGGKNSWTPLHLASHSSHFKVVTSLVEAGADVYIRTLDGKTPKDTSKGDLAIFKFLSRAEKCHLTALVKQQVSLEANSSFIKGVEAEYKNLYGNYYLNNYSGVENFALFGSQPCVRCDALYLLSQIRKKKSMKVLVSYAHKDEPLVKSEAVHGINSFNDVEVRKHQGIHSFIGPKLPRSSPLQMSVPMNVSAFFEEDTRTETVLL